MVVTAVNRRQNTLGRTILRRDHPLRVTIQAQTGTTPDDYGQITDVWEAVTGLMALPTAKAPLSAQEMQATNYTATDRVWNLFLAGAYPQITTRHRAVIDGDVYDIDVVEADTTRLHTRLQVRQVTT